jgi:predicted site-specific integrase-resolvase
MSPLSTPQVAKLAGIHRVTLERWIAAGKVKPSSHVTVGSKRFRLWTKGDVGRIRKYKAAYFRKGRGRKKRGR